MKRLRFRLSSLTLLVLVLALGACGDSDPVAPPELNVSGAWEATGDGYELTFTLSRSAEKNPVLGTWDVDGSAQYRRLPGDFTFELLVEGFQGTDGVVLLLDHGDANMLIDAFLQSDGSLAGTLSGTRALPGGGTEAFESVAITLRRSS